MCNVYHPKISTDHPNLILEGLAVFQIYHSGVAVNGFGDLGGSESG